MIPQVTVIVPHHLNENDEYLKWCLESIVRSEGVDLEVLCISDAPKEVCHLNPGGVAMYWDRSLTNFTKKWNMGLSISNPATQYVMIISDDVIVSKYTIAELVESTGDHMMIMGPASNCDATTRFHAHFYAGNKRLTLKMRMEDLAPDQEMIINFPKMTPILIDPGWISFYCTLFPRKVLDAVGQFDEKMDCRHNDVDYCVRARKFGIPSLINLGVFCLHFGDRTLPKCTSPEAYAEADRAYQDKYLHPEDAGDLL